MEIVCGVVVVMHESIFLFRNLFHSVLKESYVSKAASLLDRDFEDLLSFVKINKCVSVRVCVWQYGVGERDSTCSTTPPGGLHPRKHFTWAFLANNKGH